MNKLISNTLLLTVICTLFAACGDDGDSTPVNTNPLGLDTTLVSPRHPHLQTCCYGLGQSLGGCAFLRMDHGQRHPPIL
jgi:hypothetical protein